MDGILSVGDGSVTTETGAETTTAVVNEESTTTTTVSDFSGVVDKDGFLSDNWRELLPEGVRAEKSLDSIKNLSTLAQSYVHAQKAMGANKVVLPNSDSTPEEIDAFQRAMGRPDQATDYKIEGVEGLPDALQFAESDYNAFKEFAFSRGWSNDEVMAVANFQAKLLGEQYNQAQAKSQTEFQETEAKLKAEFGANYDATIAKCNQAIQTYGISEALSQAGLLNNYSVIKMLAEIGGSLGEGKLITNCGSISTAQDRYDQLVNDNDSPYWKNDHPLHDRAVKEVMELCKVIRPS